MLRIPYLSEQAKDESQLVTCDAKCALDIERKESTMMTVDRMV